MDKFTGDCGPWASFKMLLRCGFWSVSIASVLSAAVLASLSFDIWALVFAAYSALVHGVAFLLLGLPVFLIYWPRKESIVWSWSFGPFLGFFVAMIPTSIAHGLVHGVGSSSNYHETICLIGAYGVLSALVCIWHSKNIRRLE